MACICGQISTQHSQENHSNLPKLCLHKNKHSLTKADCWFSSLILGFRVVGNIEIAILEYYVANPTIQCRQVERESGISKKSIAMIFEKSFKKFKTFTFFTVQHFKEIEFRKRVNFSKNLFLHNILSIS